MRQASGHSYVIEGLMILRDPNRAFDWNLTDDAATTIASLVLRAARLIPNVGQASAFHGRRFEILRRHAWNRLALRVLPQVYM